MMPEVIQHDVPEYLARRQQAKRSERVVQITAIAFALACIGTATLFVDPIDQQRLDHQLTLDPETTKGLPPDIALLTKMGTFRALAIDFLFIRLERLKEENKYYELNKLSTIICKLSPHFPSVWKHAAWNMAYNISVMQYTPEGRWYWVSKGINLLRNEGLRYNQKSIGLYLELSWIFWHKIGDFLDDHHWTYKKELAIEMERVLGAPPVVLEDAGIIEHFAKVARAPDHLEDLLKDDREVANFVDGLAGVGLDANLMLLEFVARYLRSNLQIADVLKDVEEDTVRTQHEARVEYLTDPNNVAPRDRLLNCLRKSALRDLYNMEPDWMLHLMEQFGPLDWRVAYSHSLYWSTRGDMMTKGQLDLDENDSMNTVRYIFFGLKLTIARGKLIFEPNFDDPKRSFIELLPDTRFIKHLHETYLRLGKEQFGDFPDFVEGTSGPNYKTGHVADLEAGIRQLYTEGGPKNLALARKYYAYLRKYNFDAETGEVQKQYRLPLDEFVFKDFKSELSNYKRANAIIGGWIHRSLKHLSLGEVEQSIAAVKRAKQGWEYYMVDKQIEPGRTGRRHLAVFKNMYSNSIVQFVQKPDIYIMHKARLWRALDLHARQATYDQLAPYFEQLCATNEPPLDPAKAFPEPPGMEEFRKIVPDERKPKVEIDHGERI